MRGSGDREEKAMNGAIHDFHFPGRHAGPPPLPPSLAREGEERAAWPPLWLPKAIQGFGKPKERRSHLRLARPSLPLEGKGRARR